MDIGPRKYRFIRQSMPWVSWIYSIRRFVTKIVPDVKSGTEQRWYVGENTKGVEYIPYSACNKKKNLPLINGGNRALPIIQNQK
jgi:hypothetical protein